MKALERILKAMADSNRLRILKMLELRPLCNCEIQDILGLAPSTTSKHLGLLRDAGLISDERQGKWVIYRLAPADASKEVRALSQFMATWGQTDPQVQQDKNQVLALANRYACGV